MLCYDPNGSYNTQSSLYRLTAQANVIRNHAIYKPTNSSGAPIGIFQQLIFDKTHRLTFQNRLTYQEDTTLAMRKGYGGYRAIIVLFDLRVGEAHIRSCLISVHGMEVP